MGKLTGLLDNCYPPIAIYRTATVPEGAEKASDDHCVIKTFYLPSVKEGKSIYGGPEDVHCGGGWSGLNIKIDESREKLADAYSTRRKYFDTPKRVKKNYLNVTKSKDVSGDYIVFEPLSKALERGVVPDVVSFFVDPIHISALMDLAGFEYDTDESPMLMRYALACEQVYLLPHLEGKKRHSKCVLGLTEFYVRKFVDQDKFSFSIPYSLFKVMDENAERSFLIDGTWNKSIS